jgi:MFS transporter, ACS family, aldohexuronate transporter
MEDPKGSSTSAQVAEAPAPVSAGASVMKKIGRYRWSICGLLFFATTLNYMDRQVLSLVKTTLMCPANAAQAAAVLACVDAGTGKVLTGIALTEVEFGFIVAVFTAAYAFGLLLAGGFIDRVGTKIGYAVALAVWSLAAIAHAFVIYPWAVGWLGAGGRSLAEAISHIPWIGTMSWVATLAALPGAVAGFCFARVVLGLAEAANFPAAVKTVAEWFPKKERALATGIFNSGSNIGATLAPILVAWLLVTLGWQACFLIIGVVGLPWLFFWQAMYRTPERHPRVSPEELAYINSDSADVEVKATVPWKRLLTKPQGWAVFFGKLMTDPVWWFYLYWLPGFLNNQFHLSAKMMGWMIPIVYWISAIGSVFGGYLPGKFISMGWSVNKARKTAMLIYALAVMPVALVGYLNHSLWAVVLLVGLATAAHQAWSANMFTLASDMFPKRAVGSVVALGTFGSAFVFCFFSILIGYVLKWTGGNYTALYIACGSAYLLALAVIQMLAPKLKPAQVD